MGNTRTLQGAINEAIPPTNAIIKRNGSGIFVKQTIIPDFISGNQFQISQCY